MDLVTVVHKQTHAHGTRVAGPSGAEYHVSDQGLLHLIHGGAAIEKAGVKPEDAREFSEFPDTFDVRGTITSVPDDAPKPDPGIEDSGTLVSEPDPFDTLSATLGAPPASARPERTAEEGPERVQLGLLLPEAGEMPRGALYRFLDAVGVTLTERQKSMRSDSVLMAVIHEAAGNKVVDRKATLRAMEDAANPTPTKSTTKPPPRRRKRKPPPRKRA